MRRHRVALSVYAQLFFATSCIVIAPLEDIRPSESAATGHAQTCPDAGCAAVQPMSGQRVEQVTPVTASGSADAGSESSATDSSGSAACTLVAGASCDPVANCGCLVGRCDLDDSEFDAGVTPRLGCVEPRNGSKKMFDSCHFTSECAEGLFCGATNVCSPHCRVEADCASRECLVYVDENRVQIPGTGACQKACDPTDEHACGERADCRPASDTTPWRRALCYGRPLSSYPNLPEGASCSSLTDCAPGLVCAEFGPRLCTRYCRTPAQCSAERALCHMEDQRGSTGDPIGQCVAPCDNEHAPALDLSPPVWSADQQERCFSRCFDEHACVVSNCEDGERYEHCVDHNRRALASDPRSPCRGEYVRSLCSYTHGRTALDLKLDSCIDNQRDWDKRARSACVRDIQL